MKFIVRITLSYKVCRAIAAFPNEEPLHDVLRQFGVRFNELEPPYLKMAKAAAWAMRPGPDYAFMQSQIVSGLQNRGKTLKQTS